MNEKQEEEVIYEESPYFKMRAAIQAGRIYMEARANGATMEEAIKIAEENKMRWVD